jgi:hypothetical protein
MWLLPIDRQEVVDVFSYHLAVFRFNETIIVFAVRTAAGKLDKVFGTESQELVVDKLTAIIAVNAEGEGQCNTEGSDLFLDPAVGAVTSGPFLGQSGIDIGEGAAEQPVSACPTIIYGIKLEEARVALVLGGIGFHGYLVFKERADFGDASAFEHEFFPCGFQQTVNC